MHAVAVNPEATASSASARSPSRSSMARCTASIAATPSAPAASSTAERACLAGRMRLVASIDDNHRIRTALERRKTGKADGELLDLAIDADALELRVELGELAVVALLREVSEAIDALLDLREVRKRTAEPASGDERNAEALADGLNPVLGLALAADDKHYLPVACECCHYGLCLRELLIGLLEVEDLDIGLRAEHERTHGRMATALHLRKMSASAE